MIDWTMVSAIALIMSLLCGTFLWVIRAILAPIKVVIEENTKAINEVLGEMKDVNQRLQCVEVDLAVVQEKVKKLEAS